MTFKRTTPITALDLDSSDLPDASSSSKGGVTLNQIESRRMCNRLVVTGDSITASNCDMSPTANVCGDSWATHLVLASGGSLQAIYNAGHGGYTSSQLEALFDSEVVAKLPTIVGILTGTNDSLLRARRRPRRRTSSRWSRRRERPAQMYFSARSRRRERQLCPPHLHPHRRR